MPGEEVLRGQCPTEPLFKAADTQATSHPFHAYGFPDLWRHHVDLGQMVHVRLSIYPWVDHSLFHLLAVEAARSRVEPAVDARPAFGR